MNCLLVFDHLNDIVFTKYNEEFVEHVNKFAQLQGLFENVEANTDNKVDNDIIIQVFSPIITSQRIMNCQFGNSYTSIQCEDDINICFDEYMGYLFLSINKASISDIKRFISICITIVRYLCGPDVYQLKSTVGMAELATNLIDTWEMLKCREQAILIEAVEQLIVNADLCTSVIQALKNSVDKLITLTDCTKIHAMILVRNKFLSLYSSQTAKELSPIDILFCTILSQITKNKDKKIHSYQVLLSGSDSSPKCLPHIIHIISLTDGINLLFLVEVGNLAISSSLYETFCHLHTMQIVQIQRDIDILRPTFENFDISVKRLNDALKKVKNCNIDICATQLIKKWDVIRKKYIEFIKTGSDEAILRAETLTLGFLENLKQLLDLIKVDEAIITNTQNPAEYVAQIVFNQLDSYCEFLEVKAIRNFTLGSYLEDFPGLVHFIYVDRTNHRITTPDLENSLNEAENLTIKKVWYMVNFARNRLQEGTLSLMWKDTIYNYAYFLWFEDANGAPLKPAIYPTDSPRDLPVPGLLSSNFYHYIKEVCFPKMLPSKIRCYEVFCIHIGLVNASCALEHVRRLAATIWEIRGSSNNPLDLL